MLHLFELNDSEKFPHQDTTYLYDYGTPEDNEWWVNEILAHRWIRRRIEFNIRWSLGDSTWGPLSACEELVALDEYLQLHGVFIGRSIEAVRTDHVWSCLVVETVHGPCSDLPW